jgi:hypothetical protein
MSSLKNDLIGLKNKLETIESQINDQSDLIEIRKEKWEFLEREVKNVVKLNKNLYLVKLNIGGTKFTTTKETLLSVKNSFFERLINSNKLKAGEEIFIDRPAEYFHHILDYCRNKKINYSKFKKNELTKLRDEAEYYNIEEICTYLEDQLKEIEFVSFDFSGEYTYNGQVAGTNIVDDLKDKSLKTGICTNTNGWISVELNNVWDFDEIDIAGWNGNSNLWYNANGAGASIETSEDNEKWTKVGTIPSNFSATIVNVKLTRSTGRFIRFKHNSYLGLGYLHVIKKE